MIEHCRKIFQLNINKSRVWKEQHSISLWMDPYNIRSRNGVIYIIHNRRYCLSLDNLVRIIFTFLKYVLYFFSICHEMGFSLNLVSSKGAALWKVHLSAIDREKHLTETSTGADYLSQFLFKSVVFCFIVLLIPRRLASDQRGRDGWWRDCWFFSFHLYLSPGQQFFLLIFHSFFVPAPPFSLDPLHSSCEKLV